MTDDFTTPDLSFFQQDAQHHINELQKHDFFLAHSANQWLKIADEQPIPKMLFSEFWVEGELAILFADTKVGKSILAVQIADSISRGIPVRGFKLEAEKQPVLYFDFELSPKQFQKRYSSDNYTNAYLFDEGFKRIEINPQGEVPQTVSREQFLPVALECFIVESKARVIIIDNMTKIVGTDTDSAGNAKPLMDWLIELKNKYKLSILALEHTRKTDAARPIASNDLQGSKMKVNLCDSVFSIGRSARDKDLRYLKQIHSRSTEQVFDTDNVALLQISKPGNFLHFDFLGFCSEYEHLAAIEKKEERDALIERVKELTADGRSQREIARELNISLSAVHKYVHL